MRGDYYFNIVANKELTKEKYKLFHPSDKKEKTQSHKLSDFVN